MSRWVRVGTVPAERLTDTRIQLHHAVQLLTGFAQAFVPELPDDQHRNFDWDPGLPGFRTRSPAGYPDVTLTLVVPEFEVRLERADVVVETVELSGLTVDEARTGVAAAVATGLGKSEVSLPTPEFEIPDHPVAHGATFDPDRKALDELAGWYTNAFFELTRQAEAFDGPVVGEGQHPDAPHAEEVRVWPHHFDIGTLLRFDENRMIGAGVTPGDEGIESPYWYLRGYTEEGPCTGPPASPPELPAGRWHSCEWFGAVLDHEAQTGEGAGSADAQQERVRSYLEAAVAITTRWLRN